MNYKALTLIVAIAVGGMGTANGQFLKRLGKKVERAAERTVERRAERETEKKTDQALDKVLEPGNGKEEKKESPGSRRMAGIPDTYSFSYRATMEIVDGNGKEDVNVLYWLEPDATYFGTQVVVDNDANQIAVMDTEMKGMVMFMDDGEQKTALRLGSNQQLMGSRLQQVLAGQDPKDLTVTPIAAKTILGYRCKGFQMETEDGISKVWVTEEAPVGFINAAFHQGDVPDGMPDFGPNTLFMEMEYVPNDGDAGTVRMVCTELKPASLTIRTAEYQAMTSPLGIH